MVNIVLLLVCLLAGVALRHWRVVPPDAHLILNQLLVAVFIPALTLLYIPELRLTSQFWLPVLAPWVVFLTGLVFFWLVARVQGRGMGMDCQTVGTLQLTGGISRISFVGSRCSSYCTARRGWPWDYDESGRYISGGHDVGHSGGKLAHSTKTVCTGLGP